MIFGRKRNVKMRPVTIEGWLKWCHSMRLTCDKVTSFLIFSICPSAATIIRKYGILVYRPSWMMQVMQLRVRVFTLCGACTLHGHYISAGSATASRPRLSPVCVFTPFTRQQTPIRCTFCAILFPDPSFLPVFLCFESRIWHFYVHIIYIQPSQHRQCLRFVCATAHATIMWRVPISPVAVDRLFVPHTQFFHFIIIFCSHVAGEANTL